MICLVDCTESLDCPHTCKRVSFSKLNIVVRTLSVGTCSERSYRLPAHLQSFCATVLFRRSEFTVAARNMYLIYSSNTAFGWSKVTGTHQMCTVHRHGGAVRKNAIGHNHLHARCLRGDTVCADFAPDRWTHFPVRLTRCINNLPRARVRQSWRTAGSGTAWCPAPAAATSAYACTCCGNMSLPMCTRRRTSHLRSPTDAQSIIHKLLCVSCQVDPL